MRGGKAPEGRAVQALGYALAAASGVLLALSFPRYGHPLVGWIALAPLLFALVPHASLRHPQSAIRNGFVLGLLTGVIYFTCTLYWITHVMATYGDMPSWVAVLINALLIAYLSLFPALFAAIEAQLLKRWGPIALVFVPPIWVATELGRTYIITGFPWVLLGYSQVEAVPVAQLASLFGVYGVSMLVASLSATLVLAAVRSPSRARFTPLGVVLGVIAGVAVWGSRRVAAGELTRAGEPVRVGLVQGNVDQAIKWNPTRAADIFAEHISRTRESVGRGASLVLWPESSTPFMFEEDAGAAGQLRTLARETHATLLFGSDQIEWRTIDHRRVLDKLFNAAFVVRPDGTTAGVYRKMHLVPFGEYVPLKQLLFFAAPLTEQVGTFSPGARPDLLPIDGHLASVAICYEVVYPNLVRQFVAGGSELLTTITNDAWFGDTSAPFQHFEQAAMRAIENGRYLVRAANTGISGIVDPYGRVLERTGVYQPAVVVGDVRFVQERTFYTRHGDVVAYLSLAFTIVMLAVPRRRVE